MRTFKQFKVGDVEYTLSFESFTHLYPGSLNRAYLRIVGPQELVISISKHHHVESTYKVIGQYTKVLDDTNLAQEVRRIAMLFLTNQL